MDWFVFPTSYNFRKWMMPNTKVWAKCFFGEVQILRILPYHPGCPPPKKILCPKFGVWHHSLSKITWLWKYKSIKTSLGSFFWRLTWFGTGLHYFAPFKTKLSTFTHFFPIIRLNTFSIMHILHTWLKHYYKKIASTRIRTQREIVYCNHTWTPYHLSYTILRKYVMLKYLMSYTICGWNVSMQRHDVGGASTLGKQLLWGISNV